MAERPLSRLDTPAPGLDTFPIRLTIQRVEEILLSKRCAKQLVTWSAALWMAAGLCALAAGGCGENTPLPTAARPPAPTAIRSAEPRVDDAVALVNGKPISREQLVKPLVEAYGLNLLLQQIQLELARQDAAKAGVVVTPGDVARERTIMLKGLFEKADEKDYDELLAQFLKQQQLTASQWQMVLETNACLRKMAEPLCAGKITEENIRQAFDVKYGALVKIRDIQVANIADAQDVKRRLAAGEKFEDVARAVSRDKQTAALGGECPAFSFNSTQFSDLIKQEAFGLKVGEVSDPLGTENAFHIIKVEQRVAPTVAKLDAPTRQYLREALLDKLVQQAMKAIRNQLAIETMQPNIMQIKDPELRRQFEQKAAEHQAAAKEDALARQQKIHPMLGGATQPAGKASGGRPPATGSGAAPLPAAPDAPATKK
jgi:foldase protein PrsA